MRSRPDNNERIDLIDVDRDLFDDAEATDAAAQKPSRSRQVLKAVGVVTVVAVAAVVWWPRAQTPEWRVYSTAPVPVTGLSDELVFDVAPGPLRSADLAPPPVDVRPEVGYVFGAPGGTYLTSRWASFRTRATGADDAPPSTDVGNVGGVIATVKRVRVRHSVEWGPVDGRTWLVNTNRFEASEAVDFANQVAIIDGKPALAHRYDLGVMQPVGSIAAFDCVVLLTDLFDGSRNRGAALPTLVSWDAPDGQVALGSIAAPADSLPLVEFVLGDGRDTTVHELPAVAIESRVLGHVVAWVEDGRLIMVKGSLSIADLTTLAETVRPATEAEWRRIGLFNEGEASFDFADSVTLYIDVDATTGNSLSFNIQMVADQILSCIVERAEVGRSHCEARTAELPLLSTFEARGSTFVLAVVDRQLGSGAEVRIHLADETLILPLDEFGERAPGLAVATLLPAEYGAIELWVGGKLVATSIVEDSLDGG